MRSLGLFHRWCVMTTSQRETIAFLLLLLAGILISLFCNITGGWQ